MPSPSQLATGNNFIIQNEVSTKEEIRPSENQSQHLRDTEHSISPQLRHLTIRRVLSQNDLHHSFGASSNELPHLDGGHQDEVKAIKAHDDNQNQSLQNRIVEPESFKATMEVELELKQATVQELVAASQSLQQNNDTLKQECSRISEESEESNRSAIEHRLSATFAADEERKMAQQKLEDAYNANRVLAKGLATAQNHAMFCERRMVELSRAMDKTPFEVANMSRVIEVKDQMFSDLEKRARECFTTLTALEERTDEKRAIARSETAALRAELKDNQRIIADLQKSTDSFQQQCEAVFAMLVSNVEKDDLINATNDDFQIAIQDNSILKAEIIRQASGLSSQNRKAALLEIALREAARSLRKEKETSSELNLALGTKDVELGALQIEPDSIRADHQSVIEEKEGQVADAEWRMAEAYDATVELMARARGERERFFIQGKDKKSAALERKCQEQSSSFDRLERYVQTQANVSAYNADSAWKNQEALEEALRKLATAQEQLRNQEELLRGRPGF